MKPTPMMLELYPSELRLETDDEKDGKFLGENERSLKSAAAIKVKKTFKNLVVRNSDSESWTRRSL